MRHSARTRKAVSKLVPIDDVMFQKICEDAAACEEIISTILDEQVQVIQEMIEVIDLPSLLISDGNMCLLIICSVKRLR